MTGNTNIKTK